MSVFRFISLLCSLFVTVGETNSQSQMVLIPKGHYTPFYTFKNLKDDQRLKPTLVDVDAFWMDIHPVTREDYLKFVTESPQWRKSLVKKIFADTHYLKDWKSDLSFTESPSAPITFVSWFAANAYCHSQGKELPTTDQWEYAAADNMRNNEAVKDSILAWYSKPSPKHLPSVEQNRKNGFGIFDLQGLIWEWTLDFNSTLLGSETRDLGNEDQNLFCGSGAQGARDPLDYASFMRFSLRSALQAKYTVGNLGFRCVRRKDP